MPISVLLIIDGEAYDVVKGKHMARPEFGNDYHDLFSEGYLANSNEKQVLSAVITNLLREKQFESFLDIGPGDGVITKLFAQHADKVVAVEAQPNFCKKIKKILPNAEVLNSTIQDVQFDAKSFDAVLCSHMLYYLPLDQWVPFLNKIHSWVKPGGMLVVILNSGDSEWYDAVMQLSKLLKMIPGFPFSDPESCFSKVANGPLEIIKYESQFDFLGSKEDLVHYILELMLLLPKTIITEAHRKIVGNYIEKHQKKPGHFTIGFKSVVGVWNVVK